LDAARTVVGRRAETITPTTSAAQLAVAAERRDMHLLHQRLRSSLHGRARNRSIQRPGRATKLIALAAICASVLMAVPSPAAMAQQIDHGGRLVPIADAIVNDMGEGDIDLYARVNEFPSIDADNVRLDGMATQGFHRVKFGVMDNDVDSLCISVRARGANVDAELRTSVYSNSTRIGRSDWRPLTDKYGTYLMAFDTSAIDLTGKRLAVKVELRRETDDGTVQYSQVFAREACSDWAHAKLLGYGFGDGNYNPFAVDGLRPTLVLQAPSQNIARDIVEHGCAAGYVVRERITPTTRSGSLCDGPARVAFVAQKPRMDLQNFSYPYSADGSPTIEAFEAFVQQATDSERRAFLSGLVPTESKAVAAFGRYLVDDQFVFGPYAEAKSANRGEACDRIGDRMSNFRDLIQAGDFPGGDTQVATANKCKNDGDTQNEVMKVFITQGTECRLNSQYGYEFAAFGRVPGATTVNGKLTQPPPC